VGVMFGVAIHIQAVDLDLSTTFFREAVDSSRL